MPKNKHHKFWMEQKSLNDLHREIDRHRELRIFLRAIIATEKKVNETRANWEYVSLLRKLLIKNRFYFINLFSHLENGGVGVGERTAKSCIFSIILKYEIM